MRTAWLSAVLLLVATPVLAQDQAPPPPSRFEVCFGYQAARSLGDGPRWIDPFAGGNNLTISFGWNVTSPVALVVDAVHFGVTNSRYTGQTQVEYSVLAGPRLRFGNTSRLTPFAQVMVGAARGAVLYAAPAQSAAWQTFAQVAVGGGLDVRVTDGIDVRLLRVDVRHVLAAPAPHTGMSVSAGIVLHFGARQ